MTLALGIVIVVVVVFCNFLNLFVITIILFL